MKRFQFRLERVLELRKLEADVEQNRLAALEGQLEELRRRLRELAGGYQMQLSQVGVEAAERISLGDYRVSYEQRQRSVEGQLALQEQALVKQRAAYTAARQKVEVLEKVKGKQRTEWERQLQKELDDLAMDSFLARWTPPAAKRPS